jgi:hypothetical protein
MERSFARQENFVRHLGMGRQVRFFKRMRFGPKVPRLVDERVNILARVLKQVSGVRPMGATCH